MRIGTVTLFVIGFGCNPEPVADCPSEVPSRTTTFGDPVVWSDTHRCVTVAYTPALREREQEVVEGIAAWTSIDCGRTCFEAPMERALLEDGRPALFTIHVTALENGGSARSTTELTFDDATGEAHRAKVLVDPVLETAEFRRALLRGFGRALGFEAPTSSVASVLQPLASDGLSAPTAADRLAYCARYGICQR